MEHAYYTGLIDELVGRYLRDFGQLRPKDIVDVGGNKWVPNVLHCSDLGLCHKSVCHRIRGDAQQVRSAQWERNRQRKFFLANQMHNLIYAAVKYGGYEAHVEVDITERLPEKWTGRLDLDWRFVQEHDRIGVDVKSKDPRSMLYASELPQAYQVRQSGCYDLFYGVEVGWTGYVIAFFDRGGGEDPKEVMIDGEWRDIAHMEVRAEMEQLEEDVSAALMGALPLVMPKEFKLRDREKTIKLEPFWQCNKEYCDFITASCHPDTTKNVVAKRQDISHPWMMTDFGHRLYHDGYSEAFDSFTRTSGYLVTR